MLCNLSKHNTTYTIQIQTLTEKTQSMPVKVESGRIQFKLPFERPMATFEGSKITATGGAGGVVDVWEKVQ